MADYGIPAGDKVATIAEVHSRRGLGNTTGMPNASLIRLRGQFDVVLVGGNIWKGEKCSVGVELGETTPYD